MAIIRYQPWSVLNQLQDEVNKIFEQNLRKTDTDASKVATSQWMPNVDIKEESNHFVILADVPGVDPKNIEVTMDKGVLTIKGEKHFEKKAFFIDDLVYQIQLMPKALRLKVNMVF